MHTIPYTDEEQAVLAVLEGRSPPEIVAILQNSIRLEEDEASRRVLATLLSKVMKAENGREA